MGPDPCGYHADGHYVPGQLVADRFRHALPGIAAAGAATLAGIAILQKVGAARAQLSAVETRRSVNRCRKGNWRLSPPAGAFLVRRLQCGLTTARPRSDRQAC